MLELLAFFIFILCLGLILSERLNRTIVAMAGGALMTGVGLWAGFYNEDQAIAAIDFNTIGLLLGMMILVALLEPTGFFQYLAVVVGKHSRGRPVLLLFLLSLVTSVVSMFLDNVTTVVLIAPVTVLICEILGINPQPYLISEALLSNTGGVATLVGDPPNVLIGSATDLSFSDFLTHSLPIVFVVWIIAFFTLRWMFRDVLAVTPPNVEAVQELNPREALKDIPTIRRTLIVIGIAVLFFFIAEALHIRPSLVAMGAAAAALVWVRPSVSETLQRVQWDVLLFFAGLFVLIGGLRAAGAFEVVSHFVLNLGEMPPVLLGLILLWTVALLSAVVDNIPITIALIPVIQSLSIEGMEVAHLWWALVFGAGLGGNGTIIGSTANVVVASLSERTRHPITSVVWNKRGLPVMLITCAAASLLYAIFFPLFTT